MTIQQEAINLIHILPDEDVKLVTQIMLKMLAPIQEKPSFKANDISNRIGLGKGIINDPEGFDEWDSELPIYLRVNI